MPSLQLPTSPSAPAPLCARRPTPRRGLRGPQAASTGSQGGQRGPAPAPAPVAPPAQPLVLPGRRELLVGSIGAVVASASAPPALAEAVKPFCGVGGSGDTQALPIWAYGTPWDEKIVTFRGNEIWSRIVGKPPPKGLFAKSDTPPKAPVLVLHGGPGMPSRYLETLELMAGVETGPRRVFFYDQGGCGNSDSRYGFKTPPGGFTPAYFEEELAAVREQLGLAEKVHLVGHGWGGMLALEHIGARGAEGVASVSLLGTPASYAGLTQARSAALGRLPAAAQDALLAAEGGGPRGPEYEAALATYSREYLCRGVVPLPGCITAAQGARTAEVERDMCGGSYFSPAGALAGWTAEGALRRAALPPALALAGGRGELPKGGLAGAGAGGQVEVFPEAGDFAHIDAWEPLLTRINDHLEAHDA